MVSISLFRKIVLLITILLVSLQPQSIASAVETGNNNKNGTTKSLFTDTGESYKRENRVRWYDYCGPSATATDDSTSSASNTADNPDVSKVYMLGDSITLAAKSGLEAKFKEAGAKEVKIVASGGGNLGRAGTTGSRASGLQSLGADREYIKSATTVVIAHGTNGITDGEIKNAVSSIKGSGTKANIYWVDVALIESSPNINAGGNYKGMTVKSNKVIYGNQNLGYSVISWAKAVDPSYNPESATAAPKDPSGYFGADPIHPISPKGMDKFIETVVDGAKNGGGDNKNSEDSDNASEDNNTSNSNSSPQCCAEPSDESESADSAAKGTASNLSGGFCNEGTEKNKAYIWNWLLNKGLNEDAAAGIMGNMKNESSFNPAIVNPIGCLGLVQWCDRRTGMESWVRERGGDPNCVDDQLNYMWYEMTETEQGRMTAPSNARNPGHRLEIPLADALNGKDFSKKSVYSGFSKSGAAAMIFHDYFERANTGTGEDLGRDKSAQEIYSQFTGKSVESPSGDDSSSADCQEKSGGEIPSADCAELIKKIKSLSGNKITYDKESSTKADVETCSTEPPPACPVGGNVIEPASHPNTLRGIVAVAENAGVSSIQLWNIAKDHPCDEFDHPKGLATDIKQCEGKEAVGSTDPCKKVFDYAIEHKDELNISYIIWDGSYCQSKAGSNSGVSCRGDHNDHIHLSFNPS